MPDTGRLVPTIDVHLQIAIQKLLRRVPLVECARVFRDLPALVHQDHLRGGRGCRPQAHAVTTNTAHTFEVSELFRASHLF